VNDIADQLDHAFLPYIADREKRALLVELAAGIAHTHTAQVMSGATSHEAGITSPETATPEEAA